MFGDRSTRSLCVLAPAFSGSAAVAAGLFSPPTPMGSGVGDDTGPGVREPVRKGGNTPRGDLLSAEVPDRVK